MSSWSWSRGIAAVTPHARDHVNGPGWWLTRGSPLRERAGTLAVGTRGAARRRGARFPLPAASLLAVPGFAAALLAAFGVVFVAELGDKTQLLALTFGARYPLRVVVAGLALGYAMAGAIAAVVGGLLGAALPERALALAGGVVFIVFAILGWRDARTTPEDEAQRARVVLVRSAVLSIGFTIAIAEFGDKTQLATATLAARGHPFATWIGATAGEVAAGTIGAVAGSALGTRISERTLRIASAVLFAAFGVAMIVSAL
jgi:putative Ca2+/H+ antiporter (TMEM165/GDT1 family)